MDRRELIRSLTIAGSAMLVGGALPACMRSSRGSTASTSPRSSFHQANGVRLHVLEWGDPKSPPLVLLHAGMLNAHAWDDFARAMAPRFHVVAPDARGHGDSAWGAPESYNGDVFAADLHALVRQLGLEKFTLCGNSMGGTTSMWYSNLHPQMVDRLILVDTGPGPRPPAAGASTPPPPPAAGGPPRGRPAGPLSLPPGPFASEEEALRRAAETLGPAFSAVGVTWKDYARAFVHENLKRDASGALQWKFDQKGIEGGFQRGMADPRRWPFWLAIRCPTLVLRGAQSPALPQAAAEEMVRTNPNARLVVIPESGHFIALEQPAAFERAVRDWLES